MRAGILALALFCAAAAADDALPGLREKIGRALDGAPINAIRRVEGTSLYEIVWNGTNILYADAGGEYVLVGNLFRAATRENLTEARKDELLHVDFASLPLDRAFVKVKGDGSRKLAVFSDPDCPYCKQLERELAAIDNLTIYIYLYPIASLHPDAERKARLIWCARDRAKAWDALMLGGKEPDDAAAKCEAPIEEIRALAHRLNIAATPGIVFEDGKLVPGAIPRQRIETLLVTAHGK
jgi:thiol:disulfide interchange protein DsbC